MIVLGLFSLWWHENNEKLLRGLFYKSTQFIMELIEAR